MTKQEILEGARSLAKDDRIDLAMDLWSMIDADELPLSQAVRDELDRRIAADEVQPTVTRPWSEVREELLRGEII
jgi:putative addiction module component (TIGR02574 family)